MSEKILHLDASSFEDAINASKPIMVDFWAKWCGPCKMLVPILEEVANEVTDVQIGKVDVDECGDIAQRYGVMSIPTLIIFKNGEVVAQSVGYKNQIQIKTFIDENK